MFRIFYFIACPLFTDLHCLWYTNFPHSSGSVSGHSILFHWFICLSQNYISYYTYINLIGLGYARCGTTLKTQWVSTTESMFFFCEKSVAGLENWPEELSFMKWFNIVYLYKLMIPWSIWQKIALVYLRWQLNISA